MAKQKECPGKPGEMSKTASPGKRGRKRKGLCLEDRPILEPNAAGIDIGAREIFVAVPPDRDESPVRVFFTFTGDLQKMAQWLVSCGITTVAMESTGVYSDSLVRGAGATWVEAVFGECPEHEKRAGTAHRLARMPVVAVPAFGGAAARSVSTGRAGLCGAVAHASPQRSGAHDQSAHPAHAQGADGR
jgi:hypothetical protein